MGNRGTEMLCSQRRPGRPGFRHGSARARRNIIRMGAASPPPTQQRHVQPSEHLKVRDSFATQHVPVQAHADLSKSPAPRRPLPGPALLAPLIPFSLSTIHSLTDLLHPRTEKKVSELLTRTSVTMSH